MRQLSRPYLQHGSRHAPYGSDPIPGFAGVPMILAFGGASVTSSPASDHYASLDLYATTDDTIFSIEFGTGGLSSTYGITISQAGIYRATYSFYFASATNGDHLFGEAHGSNSALSNHWAFANTQQDDDTQVVYSTTVNTGTQNVEYMRIFFVAGVFDPSSGPPAHIFMSARNSDAHNFDFGANVLIERLGASYVTNGSFGDSP